MENGHGSSDLARRLSIKTAQVYAHTVGSVAPLLIAAGIDSTEEALLRGDVDHLSTEALRRFSTKLTGRIAADLNLADGREPIRSTDWRVTMYCLGSARTLREAIFRCAECFDAIDHRMGRMTLRTRSDMAELHLDSRRKMRTIAGCVIDLQGIVNLHGLLGWLIAVRLPVDHIALNYDPVLYEATGLSNFPVPVLLDVGWTGFSFPPAYLDYPVVRENDELVDLPRHSFLFSGEAEPAPTPSDQVRRFTYRALRKDHRLPSFDQVARHLNTSPATLRRRLGAEGSAYRSIKDSCRRELGLELLRGSTLTIEAISDRLDFCDSDAFRRSFRKWVGMSPKTYRHSLRDKPPEIDSEPLSA